MLVTIVNPLALMVIITLLLIQHIERKLTHPTAILLGVLETAGYVALGWQITLLSAHEHRPRTVHERCRISAEDIADYKFNKSWRLWVARVGLGSAIAIAILYVTTAWHANRGTS